MKKKIHIQNKLKSFKKSLKRNSSKRAIQDTWENLINTNTGAEHLGLDLFTKKTEKS